MARTSLDLSKSVLECETSRQYYIAIRENDVEAVNGIFGENFENKMSVLNDEIFPIESEANLDPFGGKLRSSFPIFVAAIHGCIDVFDLLMSHGADIETSDADGNNIVHALCWTGFCCKEKEKGLVATYRHIKEVLREKGGLTRLLHGEDRDGLRPLELASRLGIFHLVQAIVDTEGVYKTVHEYIGPFERVTYELAEYESWDDSNRHRKSPLRFLLHMRRNDLGELSDSFFETPLMKHWINRKFASVWFHLMAWVALHVLFVVVYLFEDEMMVGITEVTASECREENRTSRLIPAWQREFYSHIWLRETLHILILLYCYGSIINDVTELVLLVIKRKQNDIYNRPIKRGAYVTSALFFRINHFAMVTLTAGTQWISDDIMENIHLDNLVMVLYLVGGVMVLWSLLFFLQLLPSIGHLVMGFQATLATLVNFIILNTILFLSFVKAFNMIARMYCLSFVDGSIFENMYYAFKLLLDVLDDPIGKNEFGRVAFIVTHMSFVIVMVILMLNFLITAIGDVTSDVTKYDNLMRSLKRVEIAIILETRLRVFVSIFKRLGCLKPKAVTFSDIYITGMQNKHQ
ncbi:transient receptor potential cation channel subfamily V member 5-like [Lineus longissimus]|uniref:transient receptor potential cation channel subfamily V member 5-like n=1 Tax=Lineus longissimus TaxID=88925 RepID=UPI00315CB664